MTEKKVKNPVGRPPVEGLGKKINRSLTLTKGALDIIDARREQAGVAYFTDQVELDLLSYYSLLEHGALLAKLVFDRMEFCAIIEALQNQVIDWKEASLRISRPGAETILEQCLIRGFAEKRVHIRWDIDEDKLIDKIRQCDRLALVGLYDKAYQALNHDETDRRAEIVAWFKDRRKLPEPKLCLFTLKDGGRCKFYDIPFDGDIYTEREAEGLDSDFTAEILGDLYRGLDLFNQSGATTLVSILQAEIDRQESILEAKRKERDAEDISSLLRR